MAPVGNMRRHNQREKSGTKHGRTCSRAPAAFPITRATWTGLAKWAIAKTEPQEAKRYCTSKIGAKIVYIKAALTWCQTCCSLMKSPSLEDLFSEQKEMSDIASTARRVPASQKHQAKAAKHNTSLKLPPLFLQQLPETGLSKGFRGGRHMWHVFGQVSQVLQWTLGHLNPRVWAESLHSSAVNSTRFVLKPVTLKCPAA